jgi:acetyl esterase/lipase
MRKALWIACLASVACTAAERPAQPQRPPLPAATQADLKYGPHERNVLDLWLPPGEAATARPLVVYYHGGGFRAGDKRTLDRGLLAGLLESGIAVAAANYRFTDVAAYPAQHLDCALALRWLRAHATDYRLDKNKIGATGGSAGAGISLWLAFHDDLAEPQAEDPLLRESTRLTCAAVTAGQSSYDPRFIMKLFDTTGIHPALLGLSAWPGRRTWTTRGFTRCSRTARRSTMPPPTIRR